jgi:hypothetical protein
VTDALSSLLSASHLLSPAYLAATVAARATRMDVRETTGERLRCKRQPGRGRGT